jgi:hypothetical protein
MKKHTAKVFVGLIIALGVVAGSSMIHQNTSTVSLGHHDELVARIGPGTGTGSGDIK